MISSGHKYLLLFLILLLSGCVGSGGEEFGFLEEESDSASSNDDEESADPDAAEILNFSPIIDPVVVNSAATQLFTISATGKNPIVYSWTIDGATIGGETNTFYTFDSSVRAPGSYSLVATVSDGNSTSDSHLFNVVRNGPPVLSSPSPTETAIKINFQIAQVFSIQGSDANAHGITYTWKLNGSVNATYLTDAVIAGGSQTTFSPDDTLIGTNTITVEATDGYETTSQSWSVEVNRFSAACNNLAAGEVCTAAGQVSMGSPSDVSAGEIPNSQSRYFAEDGAGNLFITDLLNSAIWFYNRSGAPVTRLGKTIAAGNTEIVVGNGANGATSSGLSNENFKLYNPRGVVWDPTTSSLFIANYTGHRVVRVDSSGVARNVLCNGGTGNGFAQHSDGLPGLTHSCQEPWGLALDDTNRTLYVSSYNGHYIKKFDITDGDYNNWTGEVVVGDYNNGATGAIANGTADGTSGYGQTNASSRYPMDMEISQDGNHLYFVEYDRCRLRVVNMGGGALSLFGGAVNVAAGNVGHVAGIDGSCTTTEGAIATVRMHRPRGLALHYEAGILKGFFVSSTDHHRVMYLNNTAIDRVIGNENVPSYHGRVFFGTGTAGYNGESNSGNLTFIYSPYDLDMGSDEATLYVADVNNHRIRTIKVDVDDGVVDSFLATNPVIDFAGESNATPTDAYFYRPTGIGFNSVTNNIVVHDSSNGRSRSINTITGDLNTLVGGGLGDSAAQNQLPVDVRSRKLRDIQFVNGDMIYSDSQDSNTTNRNCDVRYFNQGTSTKTVFGVTIDAGRISTIAGNYALGCGAWLGAYEGNPATSARIQYPEGIAYIDHPTNGDELFISNRNQDCILKVDTNGDISEEIGNCGTCGNITGSYGDASIRVCDPGVIRADPVVPGNFFFVDYHKSATSYIKYVNRSASPVTVMGTPVPANFIVSLISTSGYTFGMTVNSTLVCYSSGDWYNGSAGAHHVECLDRSNGGLSIRIGPTSGDFIKAAKQFSTEQEGAVSTSARLFSPYGITFDQNDDLWISEHEGQKIRRVKKWW